MPDGNRGQLMLTSKAVKWTDDEWEWQLKNRVNSIERLREFANLTPQEEEAVSSTKGTWGATPYYASLMDRDDPSCPVRRQLVPAMAEQLNQHGIENYLIHKENRATDEKRPDSIARQYRDRIAFTVTQVCTIYCRFCFRREMVLDDKTELNMDVDEGLRWIGEHKEIRDVLVTGGDPFHLSDEKIEYIVRKVQEIPHVGTMRFGTRSVIALPHRITPRLKKVLSGNQRVPVWVSTHCNHPKELTEYTKKAVYELLSCGVNVGNQAVLLKGINDDVQTFQELHIKLLRTRIRPYYVFYCEPVPGSDHFRTELLKGRELIEKGLRGLTTGMAQPHYVVATAIGKINLMDEKNIVSMDEKEYILRNYKGETTSIPAIGA